MQVFIVLLGLIGMSTQALGEPATTQAVTPGAVTFDQLEGFIIEANIVRDQLTQRVGRQVCAQHLYRAAVV